MMFRSIALVLTCLAAPLCRADEPKSFPAAKHGKGELRYVDQVPVLTLRGTPTEMGDRGRTWHRVKGSAPARPRH